LNRKTGKIRLKKQKNIKIAQNGHSLKINQTDSLTKDRSNSKTFCCFSTVIKLQNTYKYLFIYRFGKISKVPDSSTPSNGNFVA